MLAQGVLYPGEDDHLLTSSMAAATGRVDPGKRLEPALAQWHAEVGAITNSDARLGVLSSEFYADATPERIRWVLDRLGPRTHVVLTLRPVARILTSQWQQYVQNQLTLGLDDWLGAILATPEPGAVTPSFWRRHRHDLLIESWREVVGPDRITAIVLDERDRAFLPRAFEDLLGLRRGTLSVPDLQRNRSLTYEEAELLRAFNAVWRSADGDLGDYTRFVRFGAARELVEGAAPDGLHPIRLPGWAAERVAELGAETAARIARSGIRVVGDLEHLADPPVPPEIGVNPAIASIPTEVAGAFLAGLITHLGRVQGRANDSHDPGPVQAALVGRHRAVNVVGLSDWPETLRTEIARTQERLSAERIAGEATRTEVAGELWRRLRGRLGRRGATA